MKDSNQELRTLAAKLKEQQESILEEWEERINEETDGKSTQLAAMSRSEFRDNAPVFLDRLYRSFQGEEISFAEIGEGHGSQRWEHGLNLQQTINEWGMLHKVLNDKIASFTKEIDLHSDSLNKVHDTLSAHVQEAIEYSVKEFDQLRSEETEAQLRDLEQALEEPEDISRKHNLRSTSHDLKGIMNNLQIGFRLLEDEELTPRVGELIDQMSKAADSLEQLLNDLLDLFRLETNREEIHLSEFNVANVLRELCESMQPMADNEGLELKCNGPDSLPVKSDKKKIERIARNLVLNALKYTKEGLVEVSWKKISEEHWMLKISDTGPGLSATHAESLTTDTDSSEKMEHNASHGGEENPTPSEVQKHGEGIGLLIVRHLCRLLDATTEVETESGVGTTFKIVLPLDFADPKAVK